MLLQNIHESPSQNGNVYYHKCHCWVNIWWQSDFLINIPDTSGDKLGVNTSLGGRHGFLCQYILLLKSSFG